MAAAAPLVAAAPKRPKLSNKGPVFPASSAALLNEAYASQVGIRSVKAAFSAGTPFPHVALHDVFPDDCLQRVRAELLKATYTPKRNDLYHFEQTEELKTCAMGTATQRLRDYLYSSSFRDWITAVTGIPTNNTVDISAASYTDGSYLLCHDDDLAERRIAFIIYLVPKTWAPEDGGSLDLFNTTGSNGTMPDRVVASITPAWNSMAFFAVSHESHHQVAEVLNQAKGPRLSISGWFHGPPLARPAQEFPPPLRSLRPRPPASDDDQHLVANSGVKAIISSGAATATLARSVSDPMLLWREGAEDALTSWVNPTYLRRSVLTAMAASFQQNASLQLAAFLREEMYAEVMLALGAQAWRRRGPANMRNFRACWDTGDVAAVDSSSGGATSSLSLHALSGGLRAEVVRRLFNFLTGWNFACFIRLITGSSNGTSGDAGGEEGSITVEGEVRCFSRGDYTMLCDPAYKETLVASKRKGIATVPSTEVDASITSAAAAASAVSSSSGVGSKKKGGKASSSSSSSSSSEAAPAAAAAASSAATTAIDATLCCVIADEWEEVAGGYTTYLTSDEELLTIPPKCNSLSLVQMDKEVMRFVKYVSHHAMENRYDVALTFK